MDQLELNHHEILTLESTLRAPRDRTSATVDDVLGMHDGRLERSALGFLLLRSGQGKSAGDVVETVQESSPQMMWRCRTTR